MKTGRNPKEGGETDPFKFALRELVKQLESTSYFDCRGDLLELTPAYVDARDLVHGYPVR